MKRNKKYNKEIPKETFMNGLRHIVFILIIGFAYADICNEATACNYLEEGECDFPIDGGPNISTILPSGKPPLRRFATI